jgi:hypothetical protein
MTLESKITIKVLPALHGDAICIRFVGNDSKNHNIFIDGGFATTYAKYLNPEVEKIVQANEKIDLFVITHTDNDHIGGVIQFVKNYGEKDLVEEYWFNYSNLDIPIRSSTTDISIIDGIKLREYLELKSKLPDNDITSELHVNLHGAIIRVLSPTKPVLDNYKEKWVAEEKEQDYIPLIGIDKNDYDFTIDQLSRVNFREDLKLENKISIAFLLEINETRLLFLADSHPSIVINELRNLGYSKENKLHIDCVKLSHHGSKYNTNDELLSLIQCQKFIVCANGKNRYYFPHKEALSRVINNSERDFNQPIAIIFNYDNDVLRNIFTRDEFLTFNFLCIYPNEDEHGATIVF